MKNKTNLVKTTLIDKLNDVTLKMNQSFTDSITKGNGKSVPYVCRNGTKLLFTIQNNLTKYSNRNSFEENLHFVIKVDGIDNEMEVNFDSLTFTPINERFQNVILTPLNFFMDMNQDLSLLTKKLNLYYCFNKDIDEMVQFIETSLLNNFSNYFKEYSLLKSEYINLVKQLNQYENLLFEDWKSDLLKSRNFQLNLKYCHDINFDDNDVPLSIKFYLTYNPFYLKCSTYLGGSYKERYVFGKFKSLEIIKKGKYKLNVESYNIKNPTVREYYLTDKSLNDFLSELWEYNNSDKDSIDSLKLELYEQYKLIISDSMKSNLDIYYKILHLSNGYLELTNEEI